MEAYVLRERRQAQNIGNQSELIEKLQNMSRLAVFQEKVPEKSEGTDGIVAAVSSTAVTNVGNGKFK